MITPEGLDNLFAAVWRASWQSGLMVLVALGFHRAFRKVISPGCKMVFWWLILLRLILPFTPSSSWSLFNIIPSESSLAEIVRQPIGSGQLRHAENIPDVGAQSVHPWIPEPGVVPQRDLAPSREDSSRSFYRVVSILWLGGALALLLRLFFGWLLLQRCLSRARVVTDAAALSLLEECRRLYGLKRSPILMESDRAEGPAITGFFRMRLLMPATVLSNFDPVELRHIFLHELAHARRADPMGMSLAALLEAIHWFNPLVWLAAWQMRRDAELCADAAVLDRLTPDENKTYGFTILKLLEQSVPTPKRFGVLSILGNRANIKRRIEMIATFKRKRFSSWAAVAAVGTFALFTLTDSERMSGLAHAAEVSAEGANANKSEPAPDRTLEEQEREIDKANMLKIHAAIREYYKDHKDLPNWLSDLVPKYLPDPDVLISPKEKRTGKSVLFGRQDPKLHTSYIYEFNSGPAAEEFNKNRTVPISCKDWKLMQLGKYGLITPLLRCHLHSPVLNVAYSGDFYETGLLWENDPRARALVNRKPELGPFSAQSNHQTLKVLVVDAATQKPLANAKVRVSVGSEFGLLPRQDLVTDDSGRCVFPLGEWAVNWMFVNAAHPDHVYGGYSWNANEQKDVLQPRDLTVSLLPKNAGVSNAQP